MSESNRETTQGATAAPEPTGDIIAGGRVVYTKLSHVIGVCLTLFATASSGLVVAVRGLQSLEDLERDHIQHKAHTADYEQRNDMRSNGFAADIARIQGRMEGGSDAHRSLYGPRIPLTTEPAQAPRDNTTTVVQLPARFAGREDPDEGR